MFFLSNCRHVVTCLYSMLFDCSFFFFFFQFWFFLFSFCTPMAQSTEHKMKAFFVWLFFFKHFWIFSKAACAENFLLYSTLTLAQLNYQAELINAKPSSFSNEMKRIDINNWNAAKEENNKIYSLFFFLLMDKPAQKNFLSNFIFASFAHAFAR